MPASPAFFKLLPPSDLQAQNPPAPIEQALQEVECSCLWVAKQESCDSYLRFYSDRKVISVPSTGPPAQIANWFKKPYNTWGTYHVTGSSIKFYLMDYDRTYEYQGTLDGSSMSVNLFIPETNYRAEQRFELVVFGTADDTARPDLHHSESPSNPPAAKDKPPQLQLAVNHIAVAASFPAYFGGRSNISPPAPIAGAAPVTANPPAKSPAFTLGELTYPTNLLKITFSVINTSQEIASFRLGDVQLAIGPYLFDDFAAVGHDSALCAVPEASHRKTVKGEYVAVPPATTKVFSFAYPLPDPAFQRGVLLLSKTEPVPFALPGTPSKHADPPDGTGAPHTLISRVAKWFGRKPAN